MTERLLRSKPVCARLEIIPVEDLPMIEKGDDLAALLLDRLDQAGESLADGDIIVLAQKIVSKAEGRLVDLERITPSARALDIAQNVGKDPRLIELILSESRRIVRQRHDVLIVETLLGHIVANAGIDQSNVAGPGAGAWALLLPEDPDASAEALRRALRTATGKQVGVIINDSFGRPWRLGTVGVALGVAGLPAIIDRRGDPDLLGRTLQATIIAFADEVAAAASLVMGQADEGMPIVVVRGISPNAPALPAAALIRPSNEDLFR